MLTISGEFLGNLVFLQNPKARIFEIFEKTFRNMSDIVWLMLFPRRQFNDNFANTHEDFIVLHEFLLFIYSYTFYEQCCKKYSYQTIILKRLQRDSNLEPSRL